MLVLEERGFTWCKRYPIHIQVWWENNSTNKKAIWCLLAVLVTCKEWNYQCLLWICFHWALYLEKLSASLSWIWRIFGPWFSLPFRSGYGWTQLKRDVFKRSCCGTWRETEHTVFEIWDMFSSSCPHCVKARRCCNSTLMSFSMISTSCLSCQVQEGRIMYPYKR